MVLGLFIMRGLGCEYQPRLKKVVDAQRWEWIRVAPRAMMPKSFSAIDANIFERTLLRQCLPESNDHTRERTMP